MTDPTPQTTPTRDEAVLTGWKLVPVEPTEAMMAIGRTCGTNSANTYAAMLASAPAPANGGVDAVALLRDVANSHTQYCETLHRAADIITSLSTAATPVSEAGGERLLRQMRALAMALHAKHYAEDAPGWQPLEDAEGILSQIDNMTAALAKPASSPAPVRPIGNQGISDYQREIARNMAEGFAAWNAARQEALPSDEPASSPAGGDVGDSVALSMDSDMRNSDFETWACKRGYLMHLHEGDESRRYRYSLTEEAWLGWCAALSQSTSAGRVGE